MVAGQAVIVVVNINDIVLLTVTFMIVCVYRCLCVYIGVYVCVYRCLCAQGSQLFGFNPHCSDVQLV